MRLASHGLRHGCWGALVGLSLGLLLTGCASWTNPANPSTAFADDAAACKDEVAQAALTSGQFDFDQDHAYATCLRRKGWELHQRPSPACSADHSRAMSSAMASPCSSSTANWCKGT
jgi:hypothetical protein